MASLSHYLQSTFVATNDTCQLCLRPIPKSQRDAHHLVPKSRGGVDTVMLHRLCHRQIHAFLTENQLAKHYSTIDSLKTILKLQNLLIGLAKNPPILCRLLGAVKIKGFYRILVSTNIKTNFKI